MANEVFNIALGRIVDYVDRVANNNPANAGLVVVLLQAVESDAALRRRATLADILAASGNTEADFTNYSRKVLSGSDVSAPTVDNSNNRVDVDLDDQTWPAAGGTQDNDLVKGLVCYDPDTSNSSDANIVPLTFHDFVQTTNGGPLTATINTLCRFS